MHLKRKSREYALQILYSFEVLNKIYINKNLNKVIITKEDIVNNVNLFSNYFNISYSVYKYGDILVYGVYNNINLINNIIATNSYNWELHRVNLIERNILRIAIYEIIFNSKLSKKIVINEAIEISKRFGTNKSFIFINGLLDKLII